MLGNQAWSSTQQSLPLTTVSTFFTEQWALIMFHALGLASSSDGYNIDERLPLPVFSPSNDTESQGCEDPRLSLFGNSLIMAYTAFGNHFQHQVYQIALTSINTDDFLARRWQWGERILAFPGIHNKDAVSISTEVQRRLCDVSQIRT